MKNRKIVLAAVALLTIVAGLMFTARVFADGDINVQPPSSAPDQEISEPPTIPQPLKNVVVMVDPGHGGGELGAHRDGVNEKDLTLQISTRLKVQLEQLGATVLMTRTDDSSMGLMERVHDANGRRVNLFVSVHINSSAKEETDASGIQVYYRTPQSVLFAEDVRRALIQGLGVVDGGVHKQNLCVVHQTIAPSVLAEVGYINNSEERLKLISEEYQEKIAASLANGVANFWCNEQRLKPYHDPHRLEAFRGQRPRTVHRRPVNKHQKHRKRGGRIWRI